MSVSITLDELIAELNRLGVDSGDSSGGMSVVEWAEHWGVTRMQAHGRIRKAVQNNLATAGRASRPSMDGSMRPVPVYRFTLPEKPATKKARK